MGFDVPSGQTFDDVSTAARITSFVGTNNKSMNWKIDTRC